MDKGKLKTILPYAGIPILAAALTMAYWGRRGLVPLAQDVLLAAVGYAAAVSDIRRRMVPNRLILILPAAWVLSLLLQMLIDVGPVADMLRSALLGALISGVLFLTVYFASRRGLGGGDVKFMAAAGLYLGMGAALQAMLLGSVLASLYGIVMIAIKRIKRNDSIPLIPFLYIGILSTLFFR